MRISKEELQSCVSPTNKGESVIKDSTSRFSSTGTYTQTFYDIDGSGHDSPGDAGKVVTGKLVEKHNTKDYYVLINRMGELYRDNDTYIRESARRARSEGGLPPFNLIKTTRNCFESYILFLNSDRNKGSIHLKFAQRSL